MKRSGLVHSIGCGLLMSGAVGVCAQSFNLAPAPAGLARWMYPFNASPSNRPTASVFASLGSIPDFDTRDGQYLLGWTTSNSIPAGMGEGNYLVRRARVTLTISRDLTYGYSGTLRDYRTYFPTNDPRYLPPASAGSPVELFGAGFRGGYTAQTFPQDGPFSSSGPAYHTNRNAYAAGFDTHGVLVDVSNNVGDDGTNEIAHPFEVAPFAVGQSTNVAPGELMPVGSRLVFDLNLEDPLICGYVRQALNEGGLRLIAASLLNASYFSGSPNYPDFYTPSSLIAETNEYPLLEIEGTVVRTNVDSDGDGLPDDWEEFHFSSLTNHAAADSDGDGLANAGELQAGTDPADAASALRLLGLQRTPGATELQFTFAPGRQYSVLSSDDMQQWQTVTNPVLTYSSAWLAKTDANVTYPAPVFAEWKDTNAAGQRRFYRVTVR